MAGESAAEVAQRLRQKAERQLEVAGHYEKGATGERATADALAALGSKDWVVMHDLAWPGRARANIDHVVVGPAGVFAIDTKNWSGRVEVTNDQLRQNGRQRETAVSGAAEAGLALTRIVSSATGTSVTPVLCFHQDVAVAGWARDVMVCSTSNIVEMLRSRPVVLSAEQVGRAASALDASLRPATASRSVASMAPKAPKVSKPTSAGTRRSPSRRRGSRAGALVPAIIGGLVMAVVLIPSARTAFTDQVSQFIVSTSTDQGGSQQEPARERRDQRQDRQKMDRAPR